MILILFAYCAPGSVHGEKIPLNEGGGRAGGRWITFMPACAMKSSLGMRLGIDLLVYGRVVGVSSKLGNEMLCQDPQEDRPLS